MYIEKIPEKARLRLFSYVDMCYEADEFLYSLMCAKIVSVCSILYDLGVLTFYERAQCSYDFREKAKECYDLGCEKK